MDPAAWGVDTRYHDVRGAYHRAPEATVSSLLESMGAQREGPPPARVKVVQQGTRIEVKAASELLTEDGAVVPVRGRVPPDLPPGYHRLTELDSGASTRLIVAPTACLPQEDARVWGWAAQLYALRSARSWGVGDLGDLRRLNRWASDQGAGFVLINPLHSVDPFPDQDSPYFPGSRCWRNPLYIDIAAVEGADLHGADLELLATEAKKLNDDRTIRRSEVHRVKRAALELLWRSFSGDPEFERYKKDGGKLLELFATFAALAELHGDDWHSWPHAVRHPEGPGVSLAARELAGRVDFYKWQQWLLDTQLEKASTPAGVIHDLAVGVNPRGCDAWMWQEVFAPRVSVGAPPDDFNLSGQDWGVLAFDPHRLRAAEYEPFIQTMRASFRHGKGLRIDHVMALWRLFWIPAGADPAHGTYVRYPADDLLGIVALESHRAGAVVIGEDLGNVEAGVRERLTHSNVLSYRLLYFEDSDPEGYPREALAAVTNHDLPTLPGLWSGADIAAQAAAGMEPNVEFEDAVRARIRDLTGLSPTAPAEDVVHAVYRCLARAPSCFLAATLEDALGIEERPNRPGTRDELPNWSRALPPWEEIEAHPGPRALASLLANRG